MSGTQWYRNLSPERKAKVNERDRLNARNHYWAREHCCDVYAQMCGGPSTHCRICASTIAAWVRDGWFPTREAAELALRNQIELEDLHAVRENLSQWDWQKALRLMGVAP